MRVCLSAIAALLLAQSIFAQEEPAQEQPAQEVQQEVQPKSNAVFQKIEEYVGTPSVTALEMDQEYQTFSWGGESTLSPKTFLFELEAPAHLLLTDYKQSGDSFQVYDNGELIGATRPANSTEAYAETPEDAVADKAFSKAAFTLAAGSHNISIEATSPFEFGSGAVRLVPNTQTLMTLVDNPDIDPAVVRVTRWYDVNITWTTTTTVTTSPTVSTVTTPETPVSPPPPPPPPIVPPGGGPVVPSASLAVSSASLAVASPAAAVASNAAAVASNAAAVASNAAAVASGAAVPGASVLAAPLVRSMGRGPGIRPGPDFQL